ncbi:MAG: 16S rRNA (cytidine(1402)-2'-O)-methyltransferase [bacterium]|nr:16S rRNA (cytidine(1402)-2'-O)-methyltransferase [bacterium]
MGILYLVATPIGNMEDVTLRTIRVLKETAIIAGEDTRKTGLLFQKLGIKENQRFISYYEENEARRIPEIIALLKEGSSVALVSNAGTPTISDPGFKLVRECVANEIRVEAIPGPSAILAALVSSGLPTDKFLFLGFLPKKQGKRVKVLKDSLSLPFSTTVIFFESPYRLIKTLADFLTVFGDREIVVACELTKLFERVEKKKISEFIESFKKTKPRGEYTLLINLCGK